MISINTVILKRDLCIKICIKSGQMAKLRANEIHWRAKILDMTNQEYGALVNERSRPSPVWKNCIWAFFVGGTICLLAQWLTNFYLEQGLSEDLAGGATSVTLVFVSAVLTGLGLYEKLAKHAGAGTLVPITGFANAVVAPAMEFQTEGWVTGTAAKLFVVAGPVLVFGISASVIYGVILCVLGG